MNIALCDSQVLQKQQRGPHPISPVPNRGEEMVNLNGKTLDLRTIFLEVYSVLKSELLNDPAFKWTDGSCQWVERMENEVRKLDTPWWNSEIYLENSKWQAEHVKGKLNRGLSVIDSYRLLKEEKDLTENEVFLASALDWCIEWDGMIAINDGIMLRNHIPIILKKHFREKPYYVDLLDLFNEVEFQIALGQMIDLITTIEGEKDLSKYSLPLLHVHCL